MRTRHWIQAAGIFALASTFAIVVPALMTAFSPSADGATGDTASPLPGNAGFLVGRRIAALHATPNSIELPGPFSYAQVIVHAELEDGRRVDVTRLVRPDGESKIASFTANGRIKPIAEGQDDLVFRLGDASVSVPVSASNLKELPRIDFAGDVMPVLSRAGCNAGTCHGSKDGKNGFKLSLRGYDPLFDHRALTDDHAARRVNRADPDRSLMLLKATGAVPHEGGVVIEPDSSYYKIIREWIAQGLEHDRKSPRVAKIEVTPTKPTIPLAEMTQQFRVVATFTDGETRDVTAEAFLESSNTDIAAIDASGLVTSLRRGEAAILARYQGAYAATRMFVMGDRSGFEWNDPPAFNPIDEFVYEKLQQVRVLPSEICSDDTFIRRLTLDLTGLPPTAKQVASFLEDDRPQREKRDALIDQLIGSEAYIEHRTNKWCDLLQVNGKFLGRDGAKNYRNWIRDKIAANTPYDQFAEEILTASGSNRENPAASYYKILRDPADIMENTTHLFLAVRFNCNKCHDHPFERWTQDQYYNMAAYFAQVGLKKDPESGDKRIGGTAVEGAKPLYEVVYDKEEGDVVHERTGEVAPAVFPYEHDFEKPDEASRRQALASWITSPNNQYFAKSYVNRIWAYLLGRGLIEPIDDIRAGNPPSNPALLEWLTQEFVASGFNTQELIRTICKSRTYQLAVATNQWNADDDVNFSHASARRLPAEVLLDAIYHVTGTKSSFPGVPQGTRAAALPDVGIKLPSGFLDQLGRPARESACECERSDDLMLGSVMALVNGPTIADAIANPQSEIAQLEDKIDDDRELVERLFLRVLNRHPRDEEIAPALATLNGNQEEVEAADARLRAYREELDSRFDSWLEDQQVVQWHKLGRLEAAATSGAALIPQDDLSLLAQGPNGKGTYTVIAYTDMPQITGVRLEVLRDERLPGKGPGRSEGNGNFVLSEFKVTAAPLAEPASVTEVKLVNPQADFSQGGFPINNAVDGKTDTGWAIDGQTGKDHTATFQFRKTLTPEGSTRLVFILDQQYNDDKHSLGRFRLSLTGTPGKIGLDTLPTNLMAILRKNASERTDDEKKALIAHYRNQDERYKELKRAAELVSDPRLVGAQDLTWALINSPAFLFNH